MGFVIWIRFFEIIFFSHQLDGFMGVWLGGRLYDVYGNYEFVLWLGITVSAFSAFIHFPLRERPVRAAQPA